MRLRSASNCGAGGMWNLAYDVRGARHPSGVVHVERGLEEQCVPCQPFHGHSAA